MTNIADSFADICCRNSTSPFAVLLQPSRSWHRAMLGNFIAYVKFGLFAGPFYDVSPHVCANPRVKPVGKGRWKWHQREFASTGKRCDQINDASEHLDRLLTATLSF